MEREPSAHLNAVRKEDISRLGEISLKDGLDFDGRPGDGGREPGPRAAIETSSDLVASAEAVREFELKLAERRASSGPMLVNGRVLRGKSTSARICGECSSEG